VYSGARVIFTLVVLGAVARASAHDPSAAPAIVAFNSADKTLHGLLYKPAAADASGGAESWDNSPELQAAMTRAVQHSRSPILFFQAQNDYSVAPSRMLYAAMRAAGAQAEIRIYPAFGHSPEEGHSFAYRGVDVWKDDVLRFLSDHCQR
jgi:pimeloyl-ACP methyl ester carboxylesterase